MSRAHYPSCMEIKLSGANVRFTLSDLLRFLGLPVYGDIEHATKACFVQEASNRSIEWGPADSIFLSLPESALLSVSATLTYADGDYVVKIPTGTGHIIKACDQPDDNK